MRVVLPKTQMRGVLRLMQYALCGLAVVTLGYCGFVLTDAEVFQHRENQVFDKMLADRKGTMGGATQAHPAASDQSPPAVLTGGLIGRLEIPRLNLSAMVMEGTTTRILRRSVGHIAGTALPGKPGNVGLSGHRDTFFRPLRNIRENDIITFTTVFGEYRYRVQSTKIVSPADIGVLDQGANETLTLVTCYPFYFVGSAPDRFIVRATRVA